MSANTLANLWLWRKVKRDQLDIIPEPNVKLAKRQYPVDIELSDKIRDLAKKHGISANTLINLLLQNELQKEQEETPLPKWVTDKELLKVLTEVDSVAKKRGMKLAKFLAQLLNEESQGQKAQIKVTG